MARRSINRGSQPIETSEAMQESASESSHSISGDPQVNETTTPTPSTQTTNGPALLATKGLFDGLQITQHQGIIRATALPLAPAAQDETEINPRFLSNQFWQVPLADLPADLDL